MGKKTTMVSLTLSSLVMFACSTATETNYPVLTDQPFKTLANDQLMSSGFHKPVSNFPNKGGYIGWLDTNSAFPGKVHVATDINQPAGSAVYSVAKGKIADKRTDVGGYGGEGIPGGAIVVEYINPLNNSKYYVLYGHLQNLTSKKIGDTVDLGEKIAEVGNYYVVRNGVRLNWTHIHFGINLKKSAVAGYVSSSLVSSEGWVDPTDFLNKNKPYTEVVSGIKRDEALNTILSELKIPANQTEINSSIFGTTINKPSDISSSNSYYKSVISAYNRGILNSSNFRPNDSLNRAELVSLLKRAVPIGSYQELWKTLPFKDTGNSEWWLNDLKTVYSAGILPDNISNGSYFEASKLVTKEELTGALNKANNFLKGDDSGINIYLQWSQTKADLDLYMVNSNMAVKYDASYNVSNLDEIRSSSDVVYWNKNFTSFGAILDYDSWGGNNQPQHPVSEERITVDKRKVKPGTYKVLVSYYNWNNTQSLSTANFSWWGIYRGKNINSTGVPFKDSVGMSKTKYIGTLTVK